MFFHQYKRAFVFFLFLRLTFLCVLGVCKATMKIACPFLCVCVVTDTVKLYFVQSQTKCKTKKKKKKNFSLSLLCVLGTLFDYYCTVACY